jgi:transcriptional regulator with XRE-family HTH domain
MSIEQVPAPGDRARPLTTVVAEEVRILMARYPEVKQAHLSRLLGVTQSAISARLHGRTPFDANEIGLLASFFGVTPADLVTGSPSLQGLPRLESNQQPFGQTLNPLGYDPRPSLHVVRLVPSGYDAPEDMAS